MDIKNYIGAELDEINAATDLLDKFFDQTDNTNLETLKSLYSDIKEHLGNSKYSNKEYRKYLLNVLHIVTIMIKEIEEEYRDYELLCYLADPVLSDLEKKLAGDGWSFFDLRTASIAIAYAEDYKRCAIMLEKILLDFEKYKGEDFYSYMVISPYMNASFCLLHVKYMHKDVWGENKEIGNLFLNLVNKTISSLEGRGFPQHLKAMHVRKCLGNDNVEKAVALLEEIRKESSESFYTSVLKEVEYHKHKYRHNHGPIQVSQPHEHEIKEPKELEDEITEELMDETGLSEKTVMGLTRMQYKRHYLKFVVNRIEDLLKENGLYAVNLSAGIEKYDGFMSKVLNGSTILHLDTLSDICHFFEITLRQFFEGSTIDQSNIQSVIDELEEITDLDSLQFVIDTLKNLHDVFSKKE